MKKIFILVVAILAAAGCSNPNAVPAHSAEDQKAIDELKTMSPEKQIERIQNGPMPESAKAAMIQKVKDKAGIK